MGASPRGPRASSTGSELSERGCETETVVAAVATARLGRLPVALAFGMDHTFLRVPYTEVEAQYQDGRMVSAHLNPTCSREVIRVLRLGLETSW